MCQSILTTCCQSLQAAKLALTDQRSSRVQASKIPLSIWCQDISSTSYRSGKLWLRMGSDLFQHFLQRPAAVDGKSHHHQNVVSLLSSYHHVSCSLGPAFFSQIFIPADWSHIQHAGNIFFVLAQWSKYTLFSPSKLSVIGITVSLKSSQYQTQRLTQQKQIISCSDIGIKFNIFPEESLMFTPLYFPLCCLHVSLQSNSEQFISLITAHSPREENKPVHEKAALRSQCCLPLSRSLSVWRTRCREKPWPCCAASERQGLAGLRQAGHTTPLRGREWVGVRERETES